MAKVIFKYISIAAIQHLEPPTHVIAADHRCFLSTVKPKNKAQSPKLTAYIATSSWSSYCGEPMKYDRYFEINRRMRASRVTDTRETTQKKEGHRDIRNASD